ncbi:MAG: PDZ domain-containing protein [Planctomycetota bacterium]
MSKTSGRQAFLAYAMGVVAGVLGTLIWKQWFPDPEDRDVREYREVRDFVASTFVRSLDKQELLERSLRGMTRSLDPYSRYYDRAESDEFEQETQGNYPGIGVVMRQVEGRARVLFAVPGSPADRAGLLSGDAILSVDGVKAADLPWDEFAEHMRGPAGSLVALELQGTDGALRVSKCHAGSSPTPPYGTSNGSMNRAAPRTSPCMGSRAAPPTSSIARCPKWNRRAPLVLDLRDNLGGVMESAVAIAGSVPEHGEILRTESRTASRSHVAKEAPPCGPTCRWSCWSTAAPPAPRKSWRRRCKTTVGPCCSANRPTEKASCRRSDASPVRHPREGHQRLLLLPLRPAVRTQRRGGPYLRHYAGRARGADRRRAERRAGLPRGLRHPESRTRGPAHLADPRIRAAGGLSSARPPVLAALELLADHRPEPRD